MLLFAEKILIIEGKLVDAVKSYVENNEEKQQRKLKDILHRIWPQWKLHIWSIISFDPFDQTTEFS